MLYDYMDDPFYGLNYPPVQIPVTIEDKPATESNTETFSSANRMDGHTHSHLGSTTCQDGHIHMHPGVTSTPIETDQGHFHHMKGNTSFEDDHIHRYEAYTSLPILMPGGYHTHYVELRTTEDDGHIHVIKGFTQPSKSE